MEIEKTPAMENAYPICVGYWIVCTSHTKRAGLDIYRVIMEQRLLTVRSVPPRSIGVYEKRVNTTSKARATNETVNADRKTERGAGRAIISSIESVLGGSMDT